MTHDWILDVLADLRTFAHGNGLPGLAEQLDDAAIVATAEIASRGGGAGGDTNGGIAATGDYSGAVGERFSA